MMQCLSISRPTAGLRPFPRTAKGRRGLSAEVTFPLWGESSFTFFLQAHMYSLHGAMQVHYTIIAHIWYCSASIHSADQTIGWKKSHSSALHSFSTFNKSMELITSSSFDLSITPMGYAAYSDPAPPAAAEAGSVTDTSPSPTPAVAALTAAGASS